MIVVVSLGQVEKNFFFIAVMNADFVGKNQITCRFAARSPAFSSLQRIIFIDCGWGKG